MQPVGAAPNARIELGMFAMVAAMFLVPGIDAIAKHLGGTLSPAQIACLRFLFQTLILLPVAAATGRRLGSDQWRLHLARGAFLAGALVFLIWSLRHLPLANAIAIFFVEPLLLTLLSFVVLGERFGPRRLVAVLVGLLGALVVIRPNWAEFGAASVLPLGAAACFAFYLALTRRSAGSEDPISLQLWAGIFATMFLAFALVVGGISGVGIFEPAWPSAEAWAWLALMGLISAIGHVLIGFAFQQVSASLLAPFQYLEIISATALGYLVFGEFPDGLTWVGTTIIVAAGFYVFMRERKLAGV